MALYHCFCIGFSRGFSAPSEHYFISADFILSRCYRPGYSLESIVTQLCSIVFVDEARLGNLILNQF